MDMTKITVGHESGFVFTGNICFCKKCNALLTYSEWKNYSKIIYTGVECEALKAPM